MLLKRKRSDSEISTSSSLLSSPLAASNYMSMSIDHPIQTPSLFASRTRKRHRDNRPSEADVHQHTLSLLYSAQQNPSFNPSPQNHDMPMSTFPSAMANQYSEPTQQASLHSFWSLPNARQVSPSSVSSTSSSDTSPMNISPNTSFPPTNCEDCDASLQLSDNADEMDVDMMMGIDVYGAYNNAGEAAASACTSCGKHVCHSCAVSNLGAERKCLGCAGKGKKKWVGGLGWI